MQLLPLLNWQKIMEMSIDLQNDWKMKTKINVNFQTHKTLIRPVHITGELSSHKTNRAGQVLLPALRPAGQTIKIQRDLQSAYKDSGADICLHNNYDCLTFSFSPLASQEYEKYGKVKISTFCKRRKCIT